MQFLLAIAQAGGPGPSGAGWAGGGGPWWLLFPLFWILVIGTAIWLVTRNRSQWSSSASPVQRAAEILAARYARGEIDTDEYHRRLDVLRDRL